MLLSETNRKDKTMKHKKTIGDWLPELGASLKNEAYWTVYQCGTGAFAVVKMKTIVVGPDGTAIAHYFHGHVWRGADYPHDSKWEPGDKCAREAEDARLRAEKRDTSTIPYSLFAGVNAVMPWEVIDDPPRKPWWKKLLPWRSR